MSLLQSYLIVSFFLFQGGDDMQEGRDYTAFGCCAFWRKCELGKGTCVYFKSNPAKQSACGLFKNKSQILTEISSVSATDVTESIVEEVLEKAPKYRSNRTGQFTLF